MKINQNRPSGLFRRKATILVVGPTPPPYIGPSVATKMILESELKDKFHLIHLNTSDRRNISNIGKLDFRNIFLAFLHTFELLAFLIYYSPKIVYLPICQTIIGYLRDAVFIVLSKLFGARVIIHLRGGYFRQLYETNNVFAKFVIKYSLKFVSRTIVLGESLRYIFEGLVPTDKIAVVPNGININYITDTEFDNAIKIRFNKSNLSCGMQMLFHRDQLNQSNESNEPNQLNALNEPNQSNESNQLNQIDSMTQLPNASMTDKIRILFLSNLIITKGFFDVIKAIPIITQKTIPSLEFIFAGEFHEGKDVQQEVQQYINEQNLSSYIKFFGTVDWHMKKELLLSSDIFIFPTYYHAEGQPWVIIEAMAGGLPIITTDQGCIKEMIIDGESGFIIKKQNPQQIAQKILLLLENAEMRKEMGRKSRERFLKYYTKDKFIEGLSKVFEDAGLR